jgi:hypothetical protein
VGRDPLFHDDKPVERAAGDPNTRSRLVRMQWLKLVSGGLALALLAAIWLVWRFG